MSLASRKTVQVVRLRALSSDGRIGFQMPAIMLRESLGWKIGDRILMRVSETTGNLILSRIKQRGESYDRDRATNGRA